MLVRLSLLTLAFLSLNLPAWTQDTIFFEKRIPITIGETIAFRSQILAEERIIHIYLPEGYAADSVKPYPVIYLLDGAFSGNFTQIASLVQLGAFPWIGLLPESIVVGIEDVHRAKGAEKGTKDLGDFTFPSNNAEEKVLFPNQGGSNDFIDFLEKELQPIIAQTYRTTASKTVIGQLFGGLLATEILFKRPRLFDHYIIIGPSLWWDDYSLLDYSPRSYNSPKSVFIGVGFEGSNMERAARQLYEKLRALNKADTRLFRQDYRSLDLQEILHAAVYDSFQFIFSQPGG